MAAGLFDHIKQITNVQNPKYWDTLEDADKKTWSNYMVLRFLSMKYEWVETIATLQPHIQEIPPKAMYLCLIDLITTFFIGTSLCPFFACVLNLPILSYLSSFILYLNHLFYS